MDSLVVPQMRLRLTGNGLEKKDLAMLDLLATNNWERPLYVNNTSLAQFKVDLKPYVIQEGNTFRILPILNPNPRAGELVNTEIAFENMTKKFQYRELDNPKVYYNEDYRKFVVNQRGSFNTVAEALIAEENPKKAQELLLFNLAKIPDVSVPYDYTSARSVELLLEVGEKEKAIEIATVMSERADEMLTYLIERNDLGQDLQLNLAIIGELQRVLLTYQEMELAEKLEGIYEKHRNSLGLPTRRGDM
jgi:hypothetical protein